MKTTWTLIATLGLGAAAASAQQSVVDSPHNLSASGPGSIRASSEEQVCIFCHAPHNASPIRPLWNRAMPTDAYAIYTSRALDAEPGQPTGSSKMCLSCHDGTIALGAVVSRTTPIGMVGGVQTIPPGATNLGTDLRDDHPISFRFDSSLATSDPKLRDPVGLPHEVMLDENSELQCTSCHDAHDNALGDFLVMHNGSSELCVTCHQVGTTTIAEHQQCNACHQPHTAPSGPYLLREPTIGGTCLACHDGTHTGAADIASELTRISAHETFSQVDPPEPLENHASCTDCHEAHTMMASIATTAPEVPPSFGRVSGVTGSGVPVSPANYEYEVCFKCHADSATLQPWVPRDIVQNNTRLEFGTTAISAHPVIAPGQNMDVPSLLPGWTALSLVRCADCHGSDTQASHGGFGPEGVHGSSERPLLVAGYSTADYTSESAEAYALCYTCHDRNSILRDESFTEHSLHVVEERTPCSACHDAHGIASVQGSPMNNTHLINFQTNIVSPDPGTGRLEFVDTGLNSGTCTLQCHGQTHSAEAYPAD